tara:strand:+ start:205 stop:534 length:330 start_codon:yes stop_codon:yes gene_type:complete
MSKTDDPDLEQKILRPKTKQDIYDTVPGARAIFDPESVTSTPRQSIDKFVKAAIAGAKKHNPAPRSVHPAAVARQERQQQRKEMLTKRAEEHYDKMLKNRLNEIEKNCK